MDDKQQKIVEELRRVAELLQKDSVTSREFNQYSEVSEHAVRSAFGSWNRAIKAAGLAPRPAKFAPGRMPEISDEELLAEIRRLASELGKSPSTDELEAFGQFSVKPYRTRWGRFSEAVKVALAKDGELSPGQESQLLIRFQKLRPRQTRKRY